MHCAAIIEELGALKCGHPTYEAFPVQCGLAAMTHLMSGKFRAEHLAPKDRKNFADLARGWRTMALNSFASIYLKRRSNDYGNILLWKRNDKGPKPMNAPWMEHDEPAAPSERELAHTYVERIGQEYARLRARL